VPEAISLVGFDDLIFSPILYPPITTIRQPIEALGRTAVNILIDCIAGENKAGTVIRLPVQLIERASTAPPRANPHKS
jgi:LacI family transcriptional regulator